MLTKNINFKNFQLKKINKKIKNVLFLFLKEKSSIFRSLSPINKNSYNKKITNKFKKYFNIRIIGIGGSILGTEAIYNFLRHKIKKNLIFINNLQPNIDILKQKKITLT